MRAVLLVALLSSPVAAWAEDSALPPASRLPSGALRGTTGLPDFMGLSLAVWPGQHLEIEGLASASLGSVSAGVRAGPRLVFGGPLDVGRIWSVSLLGGARYLTIGAGAITHEGWTANAVAAVEWLPVGLRRAFSVQACLGAAWFPGTGMNELVPDVRLALGAPF